MGATSMLAYSMESLGNTIDAALNGIGTFFSSAVQMLGSYTASDGVTYTTSTDSMGEYYTDGNGNKIYISGDGALQDALTSMSDELVNLMNMIWPWVLGILGAVIVVWGAYIGIRVAIAHRNEDQVNARAMIKNLIIGVVIIAVIGFGGPLLIDALVLWLS